MTGCWPECHPNLFHGVNFPDSVVHHQYKLLQVNFPIVIHVHARHESVDLRLRGVTAESAQQVSQLFRTNVTILVLKCLIK